MPTPITPPLVKTTKVGAPPPLRGTTPGHLDRFAIACRASAVVLARQGHLDPAAHLRRLAVAAQIRSRRRTEPGLLERRAA